MSDIDNASEKHPGGAPTKFDSKFCDQVYKLCLLGATDKEIADFFDIAESTINLWKHTHPEFLESITRGKIIADATVAEKLYERAVGAEWEEEQAFKLKTGKDQEEIEIVTVTKRAPPDTQAASLWLRNRRKGQWSDKTIQQLEDPNGNPLASSVVFNVSNEMIKDEVARLKDEF